MAYPYFYVSIFNGGFTGNLYSLISNNYNSSTATFKINTTLLNKEEPNNFYIFNIFPYEQIIHFRPDQSITIIFTLPDKNIISLVESDFFSPNFPNPFLQTSITFAIKEINYEDYIANKEKSKRNVDNIEIVE